MNNILYPLHTFESKIIVAVCVYNRYENIKTWIRCWKECDQQGAELVIVHNHYNEAGEQKRFKALCKDHKITYVPRSKSGFDIGAFQDVCKNRLTGFLKWDKLLWCCDDTIPMSKDFVSQFNNKLTNGVGVVCMDLSPHVRTHIRTSGFFIAKETAEKLTFEVDPITTKEDCYRFEHRDPVNWFYNQVIKMGLKVIQVNTREKSPLWDMGYVKRLHRKEEHFQAFPVTIKNKKIIFICPIYDAFPEIISSLICQTHKEWELWLICDNPEKTIAEDLISTINDSRIKFIKKERVAKYGHPLRQWALTEIKNIDVGYVVITNGDNYHSPVYCEYMIKGFQKNPDAVAVYCSDMVHSYKAWQVIPCRLQRGFIDCAGVMVKKEVATEVGWRDVDSHSSDWTYFSDIIQRYGQDKWIKVTGCLLMHN